jgi:hypothetical protein
MRGLVEKLIAFSVMSVMSIGGVGAYNLMVDEQNALSIDDLVALVDWDALSQIVVAAMGGR